MRSGIPFQKLAFINSEIPLNFLFGLTMRNNVLTEHYRCPEHLGTLQVLSAEGLAFQFGDNGASYCRADASAPTIAVDPAQIIENLRLEKYANHTNDANSLSHVAKRIARTTYYGLRPVLPLPIRAAFHRAYFWGRKERTFPKWPVDSTVEEILEKLLFLQLKATTLESVPFIWFWPNGASGCAVVTHDVETSEGRDFCPHLMDIDDEYGIKASFQIVPEQRYTVPEALLKSIRQRGFEVNVHDLNHDGQLYSDETEFLRRAKLINQYGREYKALGFRSAVLYRRAEWFHALEFNYDMSIPNVAHMDPQWGGCCTVFPYFIGRMLEIPVTITQDHTLFHVLRQYSLELWKKQICTIQKRNGLISCIVHPDYITEGKAQQTYRDLLGYLADLRSTTNLWIALPREVDQWWRARSKMRLVQRGGRWHIEGPQSDRACIAYAKLADGGITYRTEQNVAMAHAAVG